MNIKQVSTNELIEKLANELKKDENIKAPEWAKFAKTGVAKERPPISNDWWYYRTASILRNVKMMGPLGVSKLRTRYGSKKNRGVQPEKFFRGSGSIARKVLQQLEKAELIKQAEKGVHKGRVLTPKGQSLLDKIAIQMMKDSGNALKKKPIEKAPEQPKQAPKPEQKPAQAPAKK